MSRSRRVMPEKERCFVEAYVGLAGGNGAKAARLAGYAKGSAKVTASKLLKKASIQAALSVIERPERRPSNRGGKRPGAGRPRKVHPAAEWGAERAIDCPGMPVIGH